MKKTIIKWTSCWILGLLLMAAGAANAGSMKPYKGFIIFPPDGDGYSLRHDNIGGIGIRQSWPLSIEFPDYFTMIILEQGVITYSNGDQIFDEALITMYFNEAGLFLGGWVDAVIIGGTGRFDGAYGWAWLEMNLDPPLNLETMEPLRVPFLGEISTVGSLKQEE
jgi:hypothetical protein